MAKANASNENSSIQAIGQDQASDQIGGGGACCRDDGLQSSEQSQNASNSIDQNAEAKAVSVNVSPNVAVLNAGSVDQSSSSTARAKASNENEAVQAIGQDQSSTQSAGSSCSCGGHWSKGKDGRKGGQSNEQSQDASNSIDQNAEAKAFSLNASPNVAALNAGCGCHGGSVEQSSGSKAVSNASNSNDSLQLIGQIQSSDQAAGSACGCRHERGKKEQDGQSSKQSQDASNSIGQNAEAKAFSVNASPNVAVLNWGSVSQSSVSTAKANASNRNEAVQAIGQNQRSTQSRGGHGCCDD